MAVENKKDTISTIDSAPPKCELLDPASKAILRIFFLKLNAKFLTNSTLSFSILDYMPPSTLIVWPVI